MKVIEAENSLGGSAGEKNLGVKERNNRDINLEEGLIYKDMSRHSQCPTLLKSTEFSMKMNTS